MAVLCHRCGVDLDASDLFCPNCGAPQVRLNSLEEDESRSTQASAKAQLRPGAHGISWPAAIRAALIMGVPAGILSGLSMLSWGCCLWIGGGAALAVGLYCKRVPASLPLSGRSGMGMGALAGLIAACASVSTTAISRVIERFAFHRGAEIDRFYEMVIGQSSSLLHSSPAAQEQWKTYVHFLLTPDGRAAYMLLNSLTTSLGMIAVSALGGALGVRLFAAKKRV